MTLLKRDLQEINWSFVTGNNNVNLSFETFLQLFYSTLDSIKKSTRKEEKIKSKPRVNKSD